MKHEGKAKSVRDRRDHRGDFIAFALFLAFWILITASVSWDNILRGLTVSLLVTLTLRFVLRTKLPEDITLLFLLVRFPLFLVMLAWDVIKANVNLAYLLLKPRLEVDPVMVRFRTELRGDFRKTVLADSITVTPGTLTVDARGDELLVHCLTPSHKDGLLQRRHCELMVLWLFRKRHEGPEQEISS